MKCYRSQLVGVGKVLPETGTVRSKQHPCGDGMACFAWCNLYAAITRNANYSCLMSLGLEQSFIIWHCFNIISTCERRPIENRQLRLVCAQINIRIRPVACVTGLHPSLRASLSIECGASSRVSYFPTLSSLSFFSLIQTTLFASLSLHFRIFFSQAWFLAHPTLFLSTLPQL
jgi:hypothetical protein